MPRRLANDPGTQLVLPLRTLEPGLFRNSANTATGVRPGRRESWFDMLTFNVETTLRIFEATLSIKRCHIVYVSTGLVYRSQGRPLRESDPVGTVHPYGVSRQALEVKQNPNREPFTISADGKQVRDLLHVSDVVRCYLAAVTNIEGAVGNASNIGGGTHNSFSLVELFRYLEKRLDIALRYNRLEWRQSDQKYFVADKTKATRLLGWIPRVLRRKA